MANIIKQLIDSDGNNIYPVTYTPSLPIGVTLLWTNPNPTSNFAAQDVALDLSDYTFVLVYCSVSTTSNGLSGEIGIPGIDDFTFRVSCNPQNNNYNNSREFSVTRTAVSFGVCKYNNTTDNSRCIPQFIYGIKLGV